MALLPIAALLATQQLLAVVIPGLDAEGAGPGTEREAAAAWGYHMAGKVVLLRAPEGMEAEAQPPAEPPPGMSGGVSWTVWPLRLGLAELLQEVSAAVEAAAWKTGSFFAPD